EDRKSKGLMAEMSSSVFLNESYTRKDAEHLMLSMPFRIYEEMGVMNHSKYIGTIQLDKQIAKRLDVEDIDLIRKYCRDGICKYYSGNRPL
ncbi:hypothetical protein, partial [Methanobrevibacter sp.]|uniref:hypothetical protein n=1 Tax=Methanobrevibacter sp. TaxID=66852 RepID=UPI0026DF22F6